MVEAMHLMAGAARRWAAGRVEVFKRWTESGFQP
jgi:hypothetical protein